MVCPEIPMFITCITGATLGAGFYILAWYKKKSFSNIIFLEAMMQGALLLASFHLMFCMICPEMLVEIIDKEKGTPIHAASVIVKIESLHSLEIFAASMMLIVTSLRGLKTVWEHPGH